MRLGETLTVLVQLFIFVFQLFQFALHKCEVLLSGLVVTCQILKLLLGSEEFLLEFCVFAGHLPIVL